MLCWHACIIWYSIKIFRYYYVIISNWLFYNQSRYLCIICVPKRKISKNVSKLSHPQKYFIRSIEILRQHCYWYISENWRNSNFFHSRAKNFCNLKVFFFKHLHCTFRGCTWNWTGDHLFSIEHVNYSPSEHLVESEFKI